MPTFGTVSNPAHYVEVPDPLNPGQVKRPEAGTVLKARTYPEGDPLGDIVVGEYGYWDATYDAPAISVSGDDGVNWAGPLFAVESIAAAVDSVDTADAALAQSTEALAAAQDAQSVAGQINSLKWGKGNLTTEDLNTISTPGVYAQAVSSNATLARNYPLGTGGRGILEVVSITGTTNVSQRYTATFYGTVFTREYATEAWSAWKIQTPGATTDLGTSDLDTITAPGTYVQNTGANATSARHYPVLARGFLTVTSVATTTTVVQTFFAASAGQLWQREFYASAWGAWVQLSGGGSPGGGSVAGTKLVGTALTLPGGVDLNQVKTDFGGRLLLDYGATIPKWRVHVRNYNVRDSVTITGQLNMTAMVVGEADLSNGAPTGRWVSGTTSQVSPAFTLASDGSEWVSAWQTTPLLAAKRYMLGYGFTAPDSAQQVHYGWAPGWTLAGNSADVTNGGIYGTRTTQMPLDIWLECEVPDTVPVYGMVGDSLSVGHSATSPVRDSVLGAFCRAQRALPVFWAASGDTLANFTSATAVKMTRYDGMARPDVLFFALGGNDIFGSSASLSTMQTLFHATLNELRKHTTTNVVLCSVWPRLDSAAAAEDVRQAYNDWLKTTLPGGAVMYLDSASVLLDPANPRLVSTKWTASPVNIHLSTAGYARAAAAMRGTA